MIPPFYRALRYERNPHETRSSASPTPTHLAARHWPGLSIKKPSGTQASNALAQAHETGVSSARAFRACHRSGTSMAVLPNRAVKPLTSVTGTEGAPRSGTLSTWIYPYVQIALHGTLVLTRPRKALVGRPRTCSNMQRDLSLLFVGCNAVLGVGRKSQRGVSTDGRLGLIALVTVTS